MLTEERHKLILEILSKKGIVKIDEFVVLTNTSQSTIRRDLTYLEGINALKRVHGGATLIEQKYKELSYNEKLEQKIDEKSKIAKYAASLIKEGECIYLDAGTTTYEIIKYIEIKNVLVVTNGLKHIDALIEKGISTYIIGGRVRGITKAVIGNDAVKSIKKFRFDRAFMGMNGVHTDFGYTTPYIEEAAVKEAAINASKMAYVVIDDSKFDQITFCKVADISKAEIITNLKVENYNAYKKLTNIKVVSEIDLYGNV